MARVQNPHRPISGWQFAPGYGITSGYPHTWADLTSRVEAWSTAAGKQRELGIAEAGTATVVCRDIDEALNPANTSSPWNQGTVHLRLYRPIRHWEMAGPYTPGVGFSFAGNILNPTNDVWLKAAGINAGWADTTSFESGHTGAWNFGAGTTGAASTAHRHDGLQSMLITWATDPAPGILNTPAHIATYGVPLRSGDNYTVSVWVFLVTGGPVTLWCNGRTVTSTSTTNAWQRLVLTFNAHDIDSTSIYLYPAAASTAGQQIHIDGLQLEWGSSASTFTTTGPTIYPVFYGYIERYPTSWNYNGIEGMCSLGCVDVLGAFPRVNLLPIIDTEIQADKPTYWWGFDDGVGVFGSTPGSVLKQAFNQKGSDKNPIIRNWYGNGASVGANGNPGGKATADGTEGPGPDRPGTLKFQPEWNSNTPPAEPDLGCAYEQLNLTGLVGGTQAGYCVEFWFKADSGATWEQRILTLTGANINDSNDEQQFKLSSAGVFSYTYYNSSGVLTNTITTGSVNRFDNTWHHVVYVTHSNGSNITDNVYFDGVSIGTATRAGAVTEGRVSMGIAAPQSGSVGGNRWMRVAAPFRNFKGQFSNLAIYQGKNLSAARILTHYQSGTTAFEGETSFQRIGRILGYAGFSVATSTIGVTVGPCRGMGGKTVADMIKLIADTEQGLFYGGPSGLLSFTTQAEIAGSTSTLTFGEITAAGEIPYLEGATAELEPSQIYNQVTVNPFALNGDDTYLSSVVVSDTASEAIYGLRSMSLDILPSSGPNGIAQLLNMADFLLKQRAQPSLVVTGVTARVSANPSAWTKMLGLSLAQHVTWNRRTSAGVTVSVDGYIQTIDWSETPDDGCHVTVSIEPAQVPFTGTHVPPPPVDTIPTPPPPPSSTPNTIRIGTATFKLSGINPGSAGGWGGDSSFPGYRGTNQLILYQQPTVTTTITNQYGVEVSAGSNLRVSAINDRQVSGSATGTPVPTSGSVLSGHGTARDWLLQYATVGALIEVIYVPTGGGGGGGGSSSGAITKVMFIMEESWGDIAMNGSAPYYLSLAQTYGYTTNYFATTHPSLGNYIGILAGNDYGITDDNDPPSHPIAEQSIFGQAIAAGKTAKGYAESMPSNNYPTNSGNYLVRHLPWPYFTSEQNLADLYDVPLGTSSSGALHTDITAGLPNVSMVTPNAINDGHDTDLPTLDAWLNLWIPLIMAGPDYQAGNLVIMIVFDEDQDIGGNNNITTVVIHPTISSIVSGASLNHYSLTRFVGDMLGLTPLQNGASAGNIATAFGLSFTAGGGGNGGGGGGGGGPSGSYPAKLISMYHLLYSDSGTTLASVSSNVGEIRLSFANTANGGPISLVGYSGEGRSSLVAAIAAKRAAGVRIVLSVGGGGNSVDMSNTTNFVNAFAGIYTDLGGLDGIDWDVEDSSFDQGQCVSISVALKSRYGANFAITMAPNGSNVDSYLATAVQLHNSNALDNYGQQFYDAPVSLSDAESRISDALAAGLPASVISVGMMLGSDGSHWDQATCNANMTAIRGTYGLDKAYLWYSGDGGSNAWASAMNGIL